jgi:hypothetical protein
MEIQRLEEHLNSRDAPLPVLITLDWEKTQLARPLSEDIYKQSPSTRRHALYIRYETEFTLLLA